MEGDGEELVAVLAHAGVRRTQLGVGGLEPVGLEHQPADRAGQARRAPAGVTSASAALAHVGDLVGGALVDEAREQRRPVGPGVGADDGAGDRAGERRDGDGHLPEHQQRHRGAGCGGGAR